MKNKNKKDISVLFGAIIGDMMGSAYEYPAEKRTKNIDFELFPSPDSRFTDDTVLTMAVARFLLDRKRKIGASKNCADYLRDFFERYPDRGYGRNFTAWQTGKVLPESYGNGAAMRVSPVAYVVDNVAELMDLVKEITVISHNHPLAIHSATAVALAIYEVLHGADKERIKRVLVDFLGSTYVERGLIEKPEAYDSMYKKDEPVSKSFPSVLQAISCFIYTDSVEEAMRRAVACGRDSDTQASIAAAIAFPFYKETPLDIIEKAPELPVEFIDIIDEFSDQFQVPKCIMF